MMVLGRLFNGKQMGTNALRVRIQDAYRNHGETEQLDQVLRLHFVIHYHPR